jgi:hypothetical protein
VIGMRRLSALIAILLLVATAAPVLACAAGQPMTAQESACCRSMHGHCGGMRGMRCCQPQNHAESHPQLAAAAPPHEIRWVVCTGFVYLFTPRPRLAQASLRAPEHHPPPATRFVETIVLRI